MPFSPSNNHPLIALRDISVAFDNSIALTDVNLTIRKGDFVAITGPNGGGKTTLLRVILRLIKPTRGTVTYYSADTRKTVARLPIGYLPQKNNIDTRFPITVEEVIRSGLYSGWNFLKRSFNSERLQETVTLTGTRDYLHKPISELSGGQLQRTLIARALISNPQILILDEPLSYVDKDFEAQIYNLIRDLSKKTTIVLVSHEMTAISSLATQHLLVNRTLRHCSATHHLFSSPCFPIYGDIRK